MNVRKNMPYGNNRRDPENDFFDFFETTDLLMVEGIDGGLLPPLLKIS